MYWASGLLLVDIEWVMPLEMMKKQKKERRNGLTEKEILYSLRIRVGVWAFGWLRVFVAE